MTARSRGLALLVTALAYALLTGCGVQAQSAPQPLSSGDLARAGAPTLTPSTSSPTPAATESEEATVYFLRGQRLVAVQRSVERTESVEPMVASLLAGPTKTEASSGLTTAIPPGIASLDVTFVDGVGVVGVPPQFETLGGANQILAIAQLVYTITEVDGISGLQLTDGGTLVEVPNSAGELSFGPVYRADFAAFAPTGPSAAPSPART